MVQEGIRKEEPYHPEIMSLGYMHMVYTQNHKVVGPRVYVCQGTPF